MRRIVALVAVVAVVTCAAPADAIDAYPKTVLAELGSATWCSYCPQAYQGLAVVHGSYDPSEFVSVRYYAASGSYGSPDVTAALAYYGISSYPTTIFNGTVRIGGGGTAVASGAPYLGAVEATYFDPAPVQIEIDGFDPATGAIDATVTMHSQTASLNGDHIRFLLLEDNIASYHTRVTRDIVNTTITLTGAGNTAVFHESFAVDPSWDQTELHAVVFVQRAADQAVLQAAATEPAPDFRVRAVVPTSRMQIGPSNGAFNGDDFTVVNTGLGDTFTISLVVDEAPPGWVASFCDAGGGCHMDPYPFALRTDGSTEFRATVIPSSPGMMRYHFEIDSPNLAEPHVVPFTYFTDDLDAVVVDDDGGESYETYFTAALDAAGATYGVWDLAKSKLTPEAAQAFDLLIWNVGWAFPSLDADDRDFLEAYLDDGRNLFLSGQDIGWDLNTTDSGNYAPTFYTDYLHATFVSDDTNNYDLLGVAGDPVSDGLDLYIAGGDGANNQQYPSRIAPADGDGTEIFHYSSGGAGAIRSTDSTSGARIVYLAFGYEGIDNPTDRAALMGAAVGWLAVDQGEIFADGFESGDTTAWSSDVP